MATEIPKGATQFIDNECSACAFVKDGEDKNRLQMTVYSGKPIKSHWYWGTLAIDVSGIQFNQKSFPVLEEHMNSKKIGFSKKPKIENNSVEIDPDTFTFVDTEASNEFQKLSKEGFPYQSSIQAHPMSIERLEEGTSAEVNGYKLSGPAVIWRKSEYMEGSVAVFGWDSKTSASVFSKEPIKLTYDETIVKEVEEEMKIETVDQLTKEYPKLIDEVKDQMTKEFDKEKNALSAENSQLTNRVQELEKKDIIRTENEIKFNADKIWADKLSASEISEDLHEKVCVHVSYTKFVKDQILDLNAFSTAIDEEIKDWESRTVSKTIMGQGYRGKDLVNSKETELAKENKEVTNNLLALAGQKV